MGASLVACRPSVEVNVMCVQVIADITLATGPGAKGFEL